MGFHRKWIKAHRSLPFSEERERIHEKSIGSLTNTADQRNWDFAKNDLKFVKSTVCSRIVPWNLSFYQQHHFQMMPIRICPKCVAFVLFKVGMWICAV